MLMILMNLQAAPEENAGTLGAELECEYRSVVLCVHDGEDGAALVIKMNYYISWQKGRGGEGRWSFLRTLSPFSPESRTNSWKKLGGCVFESDGACRMWSSELVPSWSRAPSAG